MRWLFLFTFLAACVTSGHPPESCAEVRVDNQNFADVVVYLHDQRIGDVTGLTAKTLEICGSNHMNRPAVFGVYAVGGAFGGELDAGETIWPDSEYLIIVRGTPTQSQAFPAS